MKTITSPNGRVHLIHIHPTVYRSVRTQTVTWCGIRATRGWQTGGTAEVTCGVCSRRQQEAEPPEDEVVDGPAIGDEPAGDERPAVRSPATSGAGWWTPAGLEVPSVDGGSDTADAGGGIWSRPGPPNRPAASEWWTRPPVVLSDAVDAVPPERGDRHG